MTNATLESAILRTLAYFDLSDFPLTKEEVFVYLVEFDKASIEDTIQTLARLVEQGRAGVRFGYYFLAGHEASVEKRRVRVVWSDAKLYRAKKIVRYLAWIPFLKSVLVCNSVGRETATKESDIDVVIITEKKRLWIVRLIANSILRLTGSRTYGDHEADRLCLSYFIDTDNLDLAPFRALPEDIHGAYFIHQMVPVYDPDNWYEKLLRANRWTHHLIPHRKTTSIAPLLRSGRLGTAIKRFFEIAWRGAYGTLVEGQMKAIQELKMKFSVKERANKPDNAVVLRDGIVKLHEADSRASLHTAWIEKCRSLGL
jgi:hypothetical protein